MPMIRSFEGFGRDVDNVESSGPFLWSFGRYVDVSRASGLYPTRPRERYVEGVGAWHNLGGALAILFVAGLVMHEEEWMLSRPEGVYSFGQPRVGDAKFGNYMNEKIAEYGIKYERYVYSNDIVPRLPYDDKTFMFKHFGTCLYYNSLFFQRKVLSEEPNKKYFSLKWFIPNTMNAIWELLRSFVISIVCGTGYRESWAMLFLRTVGLVTPGLAEHELQDYDNLTRLNPPWSDIGRTD